VKSDSEIQDDVIRELRWEADVTHEHIGVAVVNGIVTLLGFVPSYIEKIAAEKAVQRVDGVKAMVEKIEVRLPGTREHDDQDIARAIVSQFRWNVKIPDELIKTRIENGHVKLVGEVEWDYQRSTAEECLQPIAGIKSISNLIHVRSRIPQPQHPRDADASSHIGLL